MENLKQLFKNILDRQKMLSPELKSLQSELEMIYEKNAMESGVIDRGYFSAFEQLLRQYRDVGKLGQYMITEEEYVSNGNLVKVPVVDLSINRENKRLFILPKSVVRDLNLGILLD